MLIQLDNLAANGAGVYTCHARPSATRRLQTWLTDLIAVMGFKPFTQRPKEASPPH